jgi:hypothetical protein
MKNKVAPLTIKEREQGDKRQRIESCIFYKLFSTTAAAADTAFH